LAQAQRPKPPNTRNYVTKLSFYYLEQDQIKYKVCNFGLDNNLQNPLSFNSCRMLSAKWLLTVRSPGCRQV